MKFNLEKNSWCKLEMIIRSNIIRKHEWNETKQKLKMMKLTTKNNHRLFWTYHPYVLTFPIAAHWPDNGHIENRKSSIIFIGFVTEMAKNDSNILQIAPMLLNTRINWKMVKSKSKIEAICSFVRFDVYTSYYTGWVDSTITGFFFLNRKSLWLRPRISCFWTIIHGNSTSSNIIRSNSLFCCFFFKCIVSTRNSPSEARKSELSVFCAEAKLWNGAETKS